MKRIFLMKKIFFIVLLFTFLPFYPSTFLPALHAGWPINRTPRIEGVVTDVTTGQPIENAVVSAEWGEATATIGGDVSRGIAYEVAVTDKEGRYKIPAKSIWHMLPYWIPMLGAGFTGVDIAVCHPLYETKRYGCGKKTGKIIGRSPPGMVLAEDSQHIGKYIMGGGPEEKICIEQSGVICYDVELLGLEERYNKSEDNYDLGSHFQNYERGGYFYILKKRGLSFDLEKIFSEWDRLAKRFPDEKLYSYIQYSLQDAKIGIQKALSEEIK